jgi:hypothetical protein
MSADQYLVEQDKKYPPSGDELPTYDDLANQNGPNSRYFETLQPKMMIIIAVQVW